MQPPFQRRVCAHGRRRRCGRQVLLAWIGGDLGILDLAYIHACAVPEAATIPHDILSTPLHVDDFVVQMPGREGERIQVPTGPGLGGELDMDAVAEYLISSGEVTA